MLRNSTGFGIKGWPSREVMDSSQREGEWEWTSGDNWGHHRRPISSLDDGDVGVLLWVLSGLFVSWTFLYALYFANLNKLIRTTRWAGNAIHWLCCPLPFPTQSCWRHMTQGWLSLCVGTKHWNPPKHNTLIVCQQTSRSKLTPWCKLQKLAVSS